MSRRWITGGLLVAAVALGACSSGSGHPAAPTPTATSRSNGAPAVNAVASADAAVAAATPGAAAPPLPVLASRGFSSGGTPLRVELNAVRVDGRITRVTFTVRNLGTSGSPWQIADRFSDEVIQDKGSDEYANDFSSADGVYLIDPAHAKRYLAARTAAGACVCSTGLGSVLVDAGTGTVLTTVFAALPADVDAIDVYVPRVGSFDRVPVSR